jgi:AraC-like DNA-binding protein
MTGSARRNSTVAVGIPRFRVDAAAAGGLVGSPLPANDRRAERRGKSVPETIPDTFAYDSIVALLEVLNEAGAGDADIEREIGHPVAMLRDPEVSAPLSIYADLFRFAAKRVDPAIGLKLISYYPAHRMHFVAHMALRSPNLEDAIRIWARYARLVCEADEISLVRRGGDAVFSYSISDPRFHLTHIHEHYLALGHHYGSLFIGSRVALKAVQFVHPKPGHAEAYLDVFGVAPIFDADSNSLVFDASYLDAPGVTADPYLSHFLNQQAEERLSTLSARDDVGKSVARAIAARLARFEPCLLGLVASDLALTEREVASALKDADTSFRDVLDQVRRDLAKGYLDDGISITEATFLLGFSEPAAFHHAFRRWFGQSAGSYRRAGGA